MKIAIKENIKESFWKKYKEKLRKFALWGGTWIITIMLWVYRIVQTWVFNNIYNNDFLGIYNVNILNNNLQYQFFE